MKKETCWNCGLDLIVAEVVRNDSGGDSILCKCGATTIPMTFPTPPIKETVSVNKAPPAPPKKAKKKPLFNPDVPRPTGEIDVKG